MGWGAAADSNHRLAGLNCSIDSSSSMASGVAELYFDAKPLPGNGLAAVQSPKIFRSTPLWMASMSALEGVPIHLPCGTSNGATSRAFRQRTDRLHTNSTIHRAHDKASSGTHSKILLSWWESLESSSLKSSASTSFSSDVVDSG